MKNIGNTFALSVMVLALSACSVAPKYLVADVETPLAYKELAGSGADQSQWKAAEPSEQLARGQWWHIFGEADLDALEAQAEVANQVLKSAAARLQQARAVLSESRSALSPQVDAGFGATRQRTSPASQGLSDQSANAASTLYRAQIGFSYEADLFGRVSSQISAAGADLERSAALFRSVKLALQADVAQSYFHLRELDANIALYDRTSSLRAQGLHLVRRRFEIGDGNELDVARATAELASARAELLGFQRQRAAVEHASAILVGTPPAGFAFADKPIARVSVAIPAGLPSSLLERRPDITAAERAMAAANARIGVAKSAFFPQLNLTGSLGFESNQLSHLGSWSTRTFLLGPLVGTMLSFPEFDAGRRDAALSREKARYDEQVSSYRQTVLKAFGEVEDSLAGLRILAQQMEQQDRAVTASERAAKLSRLRFDEGTASQFEVIDAERTVLVQRRTQVQLDGDRAQFAVSLIRALGGGWG